MAYWFKAFAKKILRHPFGGFVGRCIPAYGKLRKISNLFLNGNDLFYTRTKVTSFPTHVRIAPISVCNYKCLFCEIHKDNALYPKRTRNEFTMELLENYRSFLSRAYTLSFFGGSEEPLLCKDFADICADLKEKYSTKLMVNTNASVLTPELSSRFVKIGFDELLISYHAGTTETYRFLMTGNKEKVDANLLALKKAKESRNTNYPRVNFNYALHKMNSAEHKEIADSAKKLGVETVFVNRYYGGRNKLDSYDVSYDKEPEAGNRVLDEIYGYARQIGINLFPRKPSYWGEPASALEQHQPCACDAPWKSIHFNPVLDTKDCHYIGVCNRIELFKIHYSEANISSEDSFQRLWNHPVLQFMRATVNSVDNMNAVCRFCKDPQRAYLRNVDPTLYASRRDKAVEEFFEQAERYWEEPYTSLSGIEVLSFNPNKDDKFKEVEGL